MLALPHTNSWGFGVTNQANGSTSPGTSVIPGASDVEGSWTEIIPDADVTSDLLYMALRITSGYVSGQSKQHLLDFGWDPAGGTSYTAFLSDFACGGSIGAVAFNVIDAIHLHFPCCIPAGSALAARVQGSNATAGTIRVQAQGFGKPSRPELWRPAAYSETLGYTSGTLGTSFTPGNAAFGAWASLGTTTKKHFWAQLGVQINNATSSNHGTRYQLAVGDGTNNHVIIDTYGASGSNETNTMQFQSPCAWEIPAGSTLYVRANNSAAPVTGYNATAVLFGG